MSLPLNPSESTKRRNPEFYPTGSLAPASEPQPRDSDESVAAAPREGVNARRAVVRIKVCRARLLDEDNSYVKDLVDGLKAAGLLVDDSPKWAEIKVEQSLAECTETERTVVDIYYNA